MRSNILYTVVAMATLSTSIWAGGKVVAPIEAPVEPIPVLNTPSPVYLGLGLLFGKYSGICGSPTCPYEDATYGALVRAGYDFSQYLGLEARLLGTFFGDDAQGGQRLRHLGLFVKPMYPLGEDFNVYGLLGYGWTKSKVTAKGTSLKAFNDHGFSAGVGLEYDLSDMEDDREEDTLYENGFDGQGDQERGWGLFVDYQRLLIKSDIPDMDVVSGGVTYDF